MNDFEQEILRLEQEVLALKTCPIKTATSMTTKSVQQAVSFNMDYLGQLIQNYSWSARKIIITMTSTDGTNMLTDCTLESSGDAADYNLAGRGVTVVQTDAGSTTQYKVSAWSRNENDISILAGGGSVTRLIRRLCIQNGCGDFSFFPQNKKELFKCPLQKF